MSEEYLSPRAKPVMLKRSSILDTAPDAILDDIAYIAGRALHCPVAVISLIGGRAGADGLCGTALMHDDPWVVDNAAVDPRTLSDPIAADHVGLRFYVGVPLLAADGDKLGTLTVIARDPRPIGEAELTTLKKLAALGAHLLEMRLQLRMASRTNGLSLTSVA